MQESAGAEVELHHFAILNHIEPVEISYRAFGLAFGVAEGREVMSADKAFGGLVHGRNIDLALQMPDKTALEHRWSAAVQKFVDIMAAGGREAGMEIFILSYAICIKLITGS